MDPSAAAELITAWGYPAFLLLLLATGFGSPIPEDLLLLTGGVLIAAGVFTWPVTLPLALIGVVGSDSILYIAGWQMRTRALRRRGIRRLVRPRALGLATRWFARIGDPIVFIARLVPGTRAVVFLTAGLRRVRPSRFLLFDAAGAAIWVPALLAAGGLLGERIGGLQQLMALFSRGATWIILAGLVLLLVWYLWGREESKL